jgi:hypothetical protein
MFDCLCSFETIALRHPDVQENYVRKPVLDCFQSVAASASNAGFHAIQ